MSLDIINEALDYLGDQPLSSTSRSKTLALAQRHVKRAAKHVLRRASWTENTLTVCLDELHVCTPCCDLPDGFCFAFALPKDFISAYDVSQPADTKCHCYHRPDLHWKVARVKNSGVISNAILTDRCPVQLEYVCLPGDLSFLDGDIHDLIVLQLAIRMAVSLKADKKLKETLQRDFAILLEDAEMVSSGQDAEKLQIPNSFLLADRVGSLDVLRGTGPRDYRYDVGPGQAPRKTLAEEVSCGCRHKCDCAGVR